MKASGLTLQRIAELTGSRLEAGLQPDTLILRVAAISSADGNALVFATDADSVTAALQSDACAILVDRGKARPAEPRVLQVEDARFAFALCARALAQVQTGGPELLIDPHARVDPSAQLGARVRVAAGAVIGAEARVGDDTSIGPNVTIEAGVVVGARVVVQAGAVLGSRGFGYVRHAGTGEYLLFPQQGALVIEDDVEIGANTTIDRGALEETRIGRGTKIDNLVHIGHNCRIGSNVVIAAQVGISGSCVIEDGAVLAGQVGISDHCHIGPGVILGGQAGIYRGKTVIGPGEIFAGTPAEPLREQMRSLARLRRLR